MSASKCITLVGCCREKASSIAPARQLYKSQLFKKAAGWSDRRGDEWFVISAKHGLIKSESKLAPYDARIQGLTQDQRAKWSADVAAQLSALAAFYEVEQMEVTLLAGAAYTGWIDIVQPWCTVHQPLAGLQIGQRLQWLTAQAAAQKGGA